MIWTVIWFLSWAPNLKQSSNVQYQKGAPLSFKQNNQIAVANHQKRYEILTLLILTVFTNEPYNQPAESYDFANWSGWVSRLASPRNSPASKAKHRSLGSAWVTWLAFHGPRGNTQVDGLPNVTSPRQPIPNNLKKRTHSSPPSTLLYSDLLFSRHSALTHYETARWWSNVDLCA